MKLIINADDFGLTQGVNQAVIECHKNGILTSTTLMANALYAKEAIELAKANPTLGVGVHMVLTTLRPLLEGHKTLVNEAGDFKWKIDSIDESLDLEELYNEWDAQIASIAKEIPITHLDSHHHVHMHPLLVSVVERLSKKYGVPYRSLKTSLPNEVVCEMGFYKDGVSYEYFETLFKRDDIDVADVMTHPAHVNDHLMSISSYSTWREKELEILSNPDLKKRAAEAGVELINYTQI